MFEFTNSETQTLISACLGVFTAGYICSAATTTFSLTIAGVALGTCLFGGLVADLFGRKTASILCPIPYSIFAVLLLCDYDNMYDLQTWLAIASLPEFIIAFPMISETSWSSNYTRRMFFAVWSGLAGACIPRFFFKYITDGASLRYIVFCFPLLPAFILMICRIFYMKETESYTAVSLFRRSLEVTDFLLEERSQEDGGKSIISKKFNLLKYLLIIIPLSSLFAFCIGHTAPILTSSLHLQYSPKYWVPRNFFNFWTPIFKNDGVVYDSNPYLVASGDVQRFPADVDTSAIFIPLITFAVFHVSGFLSILLNRKFILSIGLKLALILDVIVLFSRGFYFPHEFVTNMLYLSDESMSLALEGRLLGWDNMNVTFRFHIVLCKLIILPAFIILPSLLLSTESCPTLGRCTLMACIILSYLAGQHLAFEDYSEIYIGIRHLYCSLLAAVLASILCFLLPSVSPKLIYPPSAMFDGENFVQDSDTEIAKLLKAIQQREEQVIQEQQQQMKERQAIALSAGRRQGVSVVPGGMNRISTNDHLVYPLNHNPLLKRDSISASAPPPNENDKHMSSFYAENGI